MTSQKIEAHKITQPIQVVAALIVGMVLVVSALLLGAVKVSEPGWAAGLLAIGAVLMAPLFLLFIFRLLTRYRSHLQDDPHYTAWIERQETLFRDFEPENVGGMRDAALAPEVVDLEDRRLHTYEGNRGLFLAHSWRPSMTPGQVADIVIYLEQHDEGPLTARSIDSVEYELGRKFFKAPIVKRNADEAFRLEVSAWGPMLCVARVRFTDGTPPLLLERYINFDGTL